MLINLTLDTSQKQDVSLLAAIITALGGKSPDAPDSPAKPGKASDAKLGGMAVATKPRVSIADIREACKTKTGKDCVAVFNKLGSSGLSVLPEDKFTEALELINALKDK